MDEPFIQRTALPVERVALPAAPPAEPPQAEQSPLIIASLVQGGYPVTSENVSKMRELIDQKGANQTFSELQRAYINKKDEQAGRMLGQRILEMAAPGQFDLDRDLGVMVEEAYQQFIPKNDSEVLAGAISGDTLESPEQALVALRAENESDSGMAGNIGGTLLDAVTLGVPSAIAAARFSNALGLDLGFWSLNPEAAAQAAGDKFASLPYSEKAEFLYTAVKASSEASGVVFDVTAKELRKYIDNPALLDTLSDPMQRALVLSVTNQILNVLPTTVAGKTIRTPKALTGIAAANPNIAGDVAAVALRGELPGIAPTDAAIAFSPKPFIEGADNVSAPVIEMMDAASTRAAEINSETQEITARMLGLGVDEKIVAEASVAAVQKTTEDLYGRQLVSQIKIEANPDGLGVATVSSLGKNAKGAGFSGKEALDVAASLQKFGYETRLKNIKTGELVDMDNLAIEAAAAKGQKLDGKYYVDVRREFSYSAFEAGALGKDVVNGWGWLRRLTNTLGFPSAWMKRDIYSNYVNSVYGSKALAGHLQRAMAPIRNMDPLEQDKLNTLLRFAEDFGKKNQKEPTLMDLRGAFGTDLSDNMITGFHQFKLVMNIAYQAANRMVYDIISGGRYLNEGGLRRGDPTKAVSIVNKTTGRSYSGTALDVEFAKTSGGRFYDPQQGAIVSLTGKKIDDLYARGGRIVRSPFQERVSGSVTNFHVYDPATSANWSLQPLTKFPLTKVPGYYTNIYQDRTFIYKEWRNMEVNGAQGQSFSEPVAVAGSEQEAARLIANVLKKQEPTATFTTSTPLASGLDPSLWAAARFDVSSGLIYGDRGKGLLGVNGPADLVDPINAAIKMSNVLGRSLSIEQLTARTIQGWKSEFRDVIQAAGVKNIDNMTVAEVSEMLGTLSGRRAENAATMWRYIQSLAGNTTEAPGIFRRLMYDSSQVFYNMMEKMGAKNVARSGRDYVGSADVLQAGRTAAYWDYIQLNPIGQFPLQALQPLFIAPMAAAGGKPLNYFRVFMDGHLLGQGAKWRAMEQMGGKGLTDAMIKRNASRMGMLVNEYKELVRRFDTFGMRSGVDLRAPTAEFSTHTGHLATTKVGLILQKVTSAGFKSPLSGNKLSLSRVGNAITSGFDKGEAYNVNVAFMTAFLKYQKGVRTTKGLTEADWKAINALASDYAGGMNRANRADWQNNTLSASIMQFMQFGHKGLVTLIGANRGAFGAGATAAILANQMMLWGKDGIPFLPGVLKLTESLGLTEPSDKKSFNDGLVEIAINEFINSVSEEGGNLDIGGRFAPMAGMANSVVDLYGNLVDTSPIDWLANSPTGRTASGLFEGYKTAYDLFHFTEAADPWSDEVWTEAGKAILAGHAAGVSNYRQAKLILQYGAYPTKNGNLSGVKMTTIEGWAKVAGLTSQEQADYYDIMEELDKRANPDVKVVVESASADGNAYYKRIHLALMAVGRGEDTLAHALVVAREQQRFYKDDNEVYNRAFTAALQKAHHEYKLRKEDIGTLLYKAISEGNEVSDWAIVRLRRSKTVPPEAKAAIEAELAKFKVDIKQASEINKQIIDEGVRELTKMVNKREKSTNND